MLRLDEDQKNFTFASGFIGNSFDILQTAIEQKQAKLAEYIITQHKFYHHQQRQLRNLDPRFVLHNPDSDDETLTVRIAIQGYFQNVFQLIWERFGDLYTTQQTLIVLRQILRTQVDHFLPVFLQSNTTQQAFLNMTSSQRVEFLELFSEVQGSSYYPDIYSLLQSHPYNLFEESYHRDVLA